MSPISNPSDHYSKTATKPPKKGVPTMIQDLILALVFLAMIITPAIVAMRNDKEEEDIL
jgi:hypothetical protein